MKDKEDFKKMLESYLVSDNKSNHWLRRFFRGFISGDYNHYHSGYDGYLNNIAEIDNIKKDSKKSYNHLRMLVRTYFVEFLNIEYMLPSYFFPKTIVEVFGDKLESFNQTLIGDFLSLRGYELSDFFSTELLASKQ